MPNRTLLLVLLGIAMLLGFFFWQQNRGARDKFDWTETPLHKAHSEKNDQPYGIQIFHRLLADYLPGHERIDLKKKLAATLPLDTSGHANYVFIGAAILLDSADNQRLLDFVALGNTAFISSKTLPASISDSIYTPPCGDVAWSDYDFFWDTGGVTLSLRQPSPDMRASASNPFFYARQNRPRPYRWHYIDYRCFCAENGFALLGMMNDSLANFAEVPHGRGRFLLHTAPLAFSNFHLLRPEGKAYAAGVLSHLSPGKIYWDTHSRTTEAVGRQRNGLPRSLPDEHALTYILRQPALAWAWYLLLALGLLWVITKARRRQRIIPVLPRNENSSLEFIGAIANLHFREQNFQRLCTQKMRLFLAHLRERYGFSVSLDPDTSLPRTDSTFFNRLAQTAQVPEARVRDIFDKYTACAQYQPTETMMTELHLSIEDFWKNAR